MKVIVILIIFCLSCFFIPAFSQNRIDSLHQSLANRNGIEQFDALFEIAQLYGFWNFDSSIHYAQRARMVAEQYKDTTRLIKVNERLGVFYNRISEGVKAEEYLLIGLSLASRDTVQQVKILTELSRTSQRICSLFKKRFVTRSKECAIEIRGRMSFVPWESRLVRWTT